MISNPLFRRFTAAILMFVGLFAQFQLVFACEETDGQPKAVCCCDEQSEMSGMSGGCDSGEGCQDRAGPPVPNPTECCDVSYAPVPSATATAAGWHSQKVLLLDGPQPPPPIPAAFALLDFSHTRSLLCFSPAPPPLVAGTNTYLLTKRLRI